MGEQPVSNSGGYDNGYDNDEGDLRPAQTGAGPLAISISRDFTVHLLVSPIVLVFLLVLGIIESFFPFKGQKVPFVGRKS